MKTAILTNTQGNKTIILKCKLRMNKSINNNSIYKNAIITFSNGEKEIFDAISITNKGIYTGIFILNNNNCEKFIDDGLISKENIISIIVIDKNGKSQNINFR